MRRVLAAQLDLFAWAMGPPKVERIGFRREMVACIIGPHWWFSGYLVMGDENGKVVPDLKSPIVFIGHQLRG